MKLRLRDERGTVNISSNKRDGAKIIRERKWGKRARGQRYRENSENEMSGLKRRNRGKVRG